MSRADVEPRWTEGLWWTPDGFSPGRCGHDAYVRSLELDADPVAAGPCTDAVDPDTPRFLPAPIDLHVHGGGGHDAMQGEAAIRAMLRVHARHGTGALLATSVTATVADTERFLDGVATVMSSPADDGARLLGAHLEGPFINPGKLGAQPPHARPLDLALLTDWFERGVVRIVTYAPELDPDGEMIELCRAHGVRAQLGHTLCSWAQAREAFAAGSGVTHLYNAMSGASHRDGGAAIAALAYADTAEIITDGHHVDRVAFEAARRAIPGLYSVTDATAATAMPDGEYRLGSLAVHKRGERVQLPDGTLAGSCLTTRRSLEVLREWELGWHDIARLTSVLPARWLDLDTLGRIEPGALAQWLEIRGERPVALWMSGVRRRL